ncbi:uncharacterized protein ACNLHF_022723 [Anomaloglossus baeobatrachus]
MLRLPQTLDQLVIPQEFQVININGIQQQFLLHDSGNEHGRILIFGTRDNLQLLAQSREWFADGMFSTIPALFKQLYTIHAVPVVPVVYALLTHKSCSTYQNLLQELKNMQHALQPQNLMIDFEVAAIQAFENKFPNLEKTGCFFYLSYMNFPTLKHISENSTFIPVIPNTYKSTEMLWSALLDQAYAYDKSCISRCVFKKTKKRLVMLAKLVSTFEESISKSEHLETLASTRKAEEVTFHCQCCVENTKHIHTLETELRDRVECSVERGKQICMLESRILEKETYYSDMDKELLQLYTEINQFKNRVASTDALVSTLREDLAAKTQIIADLQQVISNLSRPDMNSMSTVPTKQVCVSGTAQEETAATVSTPPRDHRSGDSETRGQVERSLQFTPIPMEDRRSSRFQGQDYSWRCESRWDANPTTSNLPNCSERQEEFYPNHKSMERINFLLRICKEIPKYDPNVDPFTSCDIFEGHCNKYSVAPEYRMELFKLWLPTHLNQRYEATWKAHPRNGQYHSEEERLSLLMSLTTGHQDVTPDILTKFKPIINDEPLSLCSRFEAMYRKVTMDQGIGIPQGMIRMFVEKFPYLDTAIRLSAAREPSLTDAAMIIEQCRQDLLHNKKSIKIRQHVPVYVKSQDERQTDSDVMFQKILCGFDKEWKTCPDRLQP